MLVDVTYHHQLQALATIQRCIPVIATSALATLADSHLVQTAPTIVHWQERQVSSTVRGLTEAQAKEKYGEVEAYEYNLGGNGKSQILGTTGFIKLVRKKSDGIVVGVHMIGARVGELIGEAQLVYNWEGTAEDVAPLVHAHPTQNEAMGEAFMALAGKPLHAHA